MKLKVIFITVAIGALMSINTFAAGINVFYDNELVTFEDAQPQIINERTMVPVRGLFEKMGYNIKWNSENRVATLSNSDIIIDAGENLLVAEAIGGRGITLEQTTMPVIVEDRLFLPLRAISQATGCVVDWDGATKSVVITSPANVVDEGEPVSDEGDMTAPAQEYLTTVFDTIEAINKEIDAIKDPVLSAICGDNSNEGMPLNTEFPNIYNLTHKLYDLEVPSGLNKVDENVKKYIAIIESGCSHSIENAETGEVDKEYIDSLKGEKEETSMMFGVALVEYFNANRVYYEGVFGEYCLDVMN